MRPRLLLAWTLAAATLLSAPVQAQRGWPAFASELWPGEGIPHLEATGAPLTLRAGPSLSDRVTATLKQVPAGTPVRFDETRYYTRRPGRLAVLRSDTISGRNMGSLRYLRRDAYYGGEYPAGRFAVVPGDTVEFLQYRAEGTCFVRVRGIVVDADWCPVYDDSSYSSVEEPVLEWWIRVTRDDVPAGWLLVEEDVVRQGARDFSGRIPDNAAVGLDEGKAIIAVVEAFWVAASEADSTVIERYIASGDPVAWAWRWRQAYAGFFLETRSLLVIEAIVHSEPLRTDGVTATVRVPWVSCPPPVHDGWEDRYHVELTQVMGSWRILDIWKPSC